MVSLLANLITGPPVCRDEEELRRWLEDPLFASGVESKKTFSMMKMTVLPRTMTLTKC